MRLDLLSAQTFLCETFELDVATCEVLGNSKKKKKHTLKTNESQSDFSLLEKQGKFLQDFSKMRPQTTILAGDGCSPQKDEEINEPHLGKNY